MLDFEFPFKPEPKLRARMGKFGVYTPEKTKNAELLIKTSALTQLPRGFKALEGPLEIQVAFHVKRPKTVAKCVRYPIKRPDLDNYIKLVSDALNGLVWKDDSQIWKLHATKVYSDVDSMFLTVVY